MQLRAKMSFRLRAVIFKAITIAIVASKQQRLSPTCRSATEQQNCDKIEVNSAKRITRSDGCTPLLVRCSVYKVCWSSLN